MNTPDKISDGYQQTVTRLLALADVRTTGDLRPWDIQVHNQATYRRILLHGSLGLGESYVDGWWDCEQLDEMIARLLRSGIEQQIKTPAFLWSTLKAKLFNLQSRLRSWQVGQHHYDLGNDLFQAMLDSSMTYSCGYWAKANDLESAQFDKLELICRKLELKPGMKLLEIGCGWGGLMRHAARYHGVECVGLTVSKEQAALGMALSRDLPVQFQLMDYRQFNPDGRLCFDRIASVGMFEHVGHKNYADFFKLAKLCLHQDGLMLLHTIGKNRAGIAIDRWIASYIFPNGALPSMGELAMAAEPYFVIEDVHNFGADYDRTLMAWHRRFVKARDSIRQRYGPGFYRMWSYYLLSCAGTFRARDNQLWQLVLSPKGRAGGYRRP